MAVSYPVAWNLLRDQGGVRAGEVVLVMGAGGALGIAGVLVARALGARVIAAAGERLEARARAASCSARTMTVNYAQPGLGGGAAGGCDVVYENISSPDAVRRRARHAAPVRAARHVRRARRRHRPGRHAHALPPPPLDHRRHRARARRSTREVFAAVAERRVRRRRSSTAIPLEQIAPAHEAALGREICSVAPCSTWRAPEAERAASERARPERHVRRDAAARAPSAARLIVARRDRSRQRALAGRARARRGLDDAAARGAAAPRGRGARRLAPQPPPARAPVRRRGARRHVLRRASCSRRSRSRSRCRR